MAPLSLGIHCRGNLMSVIIPRNTSVPCKKVIADYYRTTHDNQTIAKV